MAKLASRLVQELINFRYDSFNFEIKTRKIFVEPHPIDDAYCVKKKGSEEPPQVMLFDEVVTYITRYA
jgi:hypothetical protein